MLKGVDKKQIPTHSDTAVSKGSKAHAHSKTDLTIDSFIKSSAEVSKFFRSCATVIHNGAKRLAANANVFVGAVRKEQERTFSPENKVHWHLKKEAEVVGEADQKKAYKILGDVKARYLQRLAKNPNISPRNKLKLVYTVLHKMGFVLKDQDNCLFTDNLIRKRLDCDTSSFVVRALAEELGWPVSLVEFPEHVFVRWNGGGDAFNIDCGLFLPDKVYKREYKLTEDIPNYTSPYEAIVYDNLGIALNANGEHVEAVKAYKEAIRLWPKSAVNFYNMGVALGENGEHVEAVKAYKEVIRLWPKYANAFYNMGVALGKSGEHVEAIKAYKEAIRLRPKHADTFCGIGNSLYAKGEYIKAAKAYKEAIRLRPKDADTFYNLALALEASGDERGASRAFKKSAALEKSRI